MNSMLIFFFFSGFISGSLSFILIGSFLNAKRIKYLREHERHLTKHIENIMKSQFEKDTEPGKILSMVKKEKDE